MKISKEFKFEAAHRLSDYEGKCARIHGHNYKVIVTLEGEELNHAGILVDFGIIKDFMKTEISNKFDHKLILQEEQENIKLTSAFPDDWIVWVSYNPTAENMAIDFLKIIKEVLPQTSSVIVYETDDSYAEAN